MKKRSLALVVCFLLSLLSACADQTEETQMDRPPTDAPIAEAPQADDTEVRIVNDVNIIVDTVGKSFTAKDGTVLLIATVSVPHIDDPAYEQSGSVINQYFAQLTENHLQYAEDELYPYAYYAYTNRGGNTFTPYSFEEFYETTYNTNGHVSFLRSIVETPSENASGDVTVSETFRMEDGVLITGSDLFTQDAAQAREKVLSLILQQYQALPAGEKATYFDTFEESLDFAFDLDQFYLTEEGIVFYILPYLVSPPEYGAREFLIQYSEIEDIFALW